MPLNAIFTFQKLARDIIWTSRRIINSKMIGSFKQIKILFDQIEVFHSFFILIDELSRDWKSIYLIMCCVKYSFTRLTRVHRDSLRKRDNRIKEEARRSESKLTLNRFTNKRKKKREENTEEDLV